MRATAKPKRCLAPLIEVATHVRRRESVGATAQADAIADDGEADDGSVTTTARADESDGEAKAVLSTFDRSANASAAARVDLERWRKPMRLQTTAKPTMAVLAQRREPMRATAKPKRCLAPLIQVEKHVRRRESTWSDGASRCDCRRRRSRRWSCDYNGES